MKSVLRKIKWRIPFSLTAFICLIVINAVAQETIIHGKVVSSEGNPLIGATVEIKDSQNRASTDSTGSFAIGSTNGKWLVISYVGYSTQEVAIDGDRFYNIVMAPVQDGLEEVVVVGYGVQKKESVVGAISTVNMREMKTAVPRSLTNALAGRVAGVISVQRSGEPGNDDAQFWIRGVSTFGAGSAPLILIDGVERPLSNVEPEDIENFSILKDAAATAVYGIRGANGVVLVTTRRGANQKPSINFKYETILKQATMLPQFVDGPTFMELYNEAELATNPGRPAPRFTQADIDMTRANEDPYVYPNVDWLGIMLKKNTPSNRASLNVTGGSEAAKYFVSASYMNESGMWKEDNLNDYKTNTNLNRYNFRTNTDVKLGKWTDVALGLGGFLVTVNYPGSSSDQLYNLIWQTSPVLFAPYYPDKNDPSHKLFASASESSVRNPYHDLVNRGFQTTWNSAVQSDINLKHDFGYLLQGLKASGIFAFDSYNWHNIQRTRNWGDTYQLTGRDEFGELDLAEKSGQRDLNFSKGAGGNRRIYLQANLTYDRVFGNHTIGALLLYNQQDFVNADAADNISALPSRFQGLVGRISYNYRNRYYLEGSTGYNGSENFEKGNRFGLFPAIAFGWVVSEEDFFPSTRRGVSYLKLRGSIGSKGNDQIGGRRFGYLTTVGGGNGGWIFGRDFNNAIGGRGEDEYGSNLTWEREREINVGAEIRFLDGFYLQADVFERRRTNIFVQRSSLPYTFGVVKTPWGNIGEMHNKGIDASLEYQHRFGEVDLTFRSNFTYALNKVIENDQPDYQYIYQNRKGKRFGQPFGLVADGLFSENDFLDVASGTLRPSLPSHSFGNVRPGDIKYRDINGDGIIDVNDQVAVGNPANPGIIYGFGTSLGFRNFDVSVFFQGSGIMSFNLSGQGWTPFLEGINTNLLEVATNRWTPENPQEDVIFPRLSVGANQNNTRPSTWWLRDASYLRLKTAEIGYTLPGKLTSRFKTNSLRVFVSGLNLFTWSGFEYWDPELGNGLAGANGAKYPIQRTYNVGINANF